MTFSNGENEAESGGALCLSFHREIFGLVQEVIGLFHDKGRNIAQGISKCLKFLNVSVHKTDQKQTD